MSAYAPPPPAFTPPPKVVPDYSINFVDAIKRGFRLYLAFDGRASRAEFWYWYLFATGVLLALVMPASAIGSTTTSADGSIKPIFIVMFVVAGLFYAAVILPTLAIACRRLHDAGFSGLYLLLGLITGLIPLIMCILPTSPKAVQYGPSGLPTEPGPSWAGQPGQPAPPTQPAQPTQPGPYGLPPGAYGGQPVQQGQGQPYGPGPGPGPGPGQPPPEAWRAPPSPYEPPRS